MTNEDIKAALTSAKPVQITLTEEEEAYVLGLFGEDPVLAEHNKQQAFQAFQDAVNERVNLVVDEALQLLEQREEQQSDLQTIAVELLKDQIIERMTPGLTVTQRERLRSHAVSWELDLLSADPFGEFGMRVERFVKDFFPRPSPPGTGINDLTDECVYVVEAPDPVVEQALTFSHWLNGRAR